MSKRLPLLQQLLDSNPNDSFALFAIAKEYEGMGDLQQSLDFYQRLLTTNPGYVGLYYHLGKLYEKLENQPEALVAYRQGMEVARKAGDRHALGELNEARMELDDSDEDF
jgi:tetratricopeptide (TPR) repeat protein